MTNVFSQVSSWLQGPNSRTAINLPQRELSVRKKRHKTKETGKQALKMWKCKSSVIFTSQSSDIWAHMLIWSSVRSHHVSESTVLQGRWSSILQSFKMLYIFSRQKNKKSNEKPNNILQHKKAQSLSFATKQCINKNMVVVHLWYFHQRHFLSSSALTRKWWSETQISGCQHSPLQAPCPSE